jgi:hypothetical protein
VENDEDSTLDEDFHRRCVMKLIELKLSRAMDDYDAMVQEMEMLAYQEKKELQREPQPEQTDTTVRLDSVQKLDRRNGPLLSKEGKVISILDHFILTHKSFRL